MIYEFEKQWFMR